MNDSNQIRDAFAHYRYRRASQLLEGDSDAHWVIAYQHADELIDFDSFEAAWVLQESAITAQRETLARVEAQLAEAVGLIRGALEFCPTLEWENMQAFLHEYAQAEQQEAREPVLARPEHGVSLDEAMTLSMDRYSGALDKLAVIEQQEAQGAQAGDERAAFEGFIRSRYPKTSLERIDRPGAEAHGEYESSTLHVGWIIWQARAALATQPAAKKTLDEMRNTREWLYGYRAALNAASLEFRRADGTPGKVSKRLLELRRETFTQPAVRGAEQ